MDRQDDCPGRFGVGLDHQQHGKFTYGLHYYGRALGYTVFMVYETYDSFLSTAEPYYCWEFLVNGKPQIEGIDGTDLNAGDEVTFVFTHYIPEEHGGTTLEAETSFKSHSFNRWVPPESLRLPDQSLRHFLA